MKRISVIAALLIGLASIALPANGEGNSAQQNSNNGDSGIRSLGYPVMGHQYESGPANGAPFIKTDLVDEDSKFWNKTNQATTPKGYATVGSAATNPITCHTNPCQVYTGSIALIPVFVGNWNTTNQSNWNTVLGNLTGTLNAGSIETAAHVFNTNSLYFSLKSISRPTLTWYANSYITAPTATSVSDSSVLSYIKTFITTNGSWITSTVPSTSKKMYVYIGASSTRLSSGFGTSYCGWHTYGTLSGASTPYIAIQDFTSKYLSACAAQSVSPNNNPYLDAMASVLVHEIDEAITDPFLNSYYDSKGAENADKCAWTFGSTSTGTNSSGSYKYNWVGGSYQYLIQQNWLANNLVTASGASTGTACTITV